ncbi:MAG: FAD-dependent monooxygenase [Spirochaetota bacterium]
MKDSMTTEVLIIGGGPTGMVSGLCLAKLGIRNIILERRATLMEHPKAHELSARSIEILQDLGFSYEELAEEASDKNTAARILFCNSINEEYGRIDLRANGIEEKYKQHLRSPEPYLNISQTELERVMRRHIEKSQTKLLLNHQWESFTQEADGVNCIVRRLSDGTSTAIKSRYVICADGAGGRTRLALGIKMHGPERIQDFVNAYFTNDLSEYVNTTAKLYWICKPECAGTFIAHHPKKRWVYHLPIYPPYEKVEDYTPEILQLRIRDALAAPNMDIQIESISHWRMTAQVAERFRQENCFLVGDTAHRFPPTGGLGMNSGIGDAHNLCWKLKAVLREGANPALLDTYETERRPVIERNCEESRRNYQDIFAVPGVLGANPDKLEKLAVLMSYVPLRFLPNAWKKALTRRFLKLVGYFATRSYKKPGVSAHMQETIAAQIGHFDRIGLDLGYSYTNSKMNQPSNRVTEYQPNTKPGSRFPHFPIDQEGLLSSHEYLDYNSWTLWLGTSTEKWTTTITLSKRLPTVKVIQIEYKSMAWQHLGISSDGAVLVRPDGHVAWRTSSTNNLRKDLQTALEKIFILKTVQKN